MFQVQVGIENTLFTIWFFTTFYYRSIIILNNFDYKLFLQFFTQLSLINCIIPVSAESHENQ